MYAWNKPKQNFLIYSTHATKVKDENWFDPIQHFVGNFSSKTSTSNFDIFSLNFYLNNGIIRNAAEPKDEPVATGTDGKRKISSYADVPNDMFYCHLCAKHMWDSTSFENHLKGRTHQVSEIQNSKILLKCNN